MSSKKKVCSRRDVGSLCWYWEPANEEWYKVKILSNSKSKKDCTFEFQHFREGGVRKKSTVTNPLFAENSKIEPAPPGREHPTSKNKTLRAALKEHRMKAPKLSVPQQPHGPRSLPKSSSGDRYDMLRDIFSTTMPGDLAS